MHLRLNQHFIKLAFTDLIEKFRTPISRLKCLIQDKRTESKSSATRTSKGKYIKC